jgi:hypothetical protein
MLWKQFDGQLDGLPEMTNVTAFTGLCFHVCNGWEDVVASNIIEPSIQLPGYEMDERIGCPD